MSRGTAQSVLDKARQDALYIWDKNESSDISDVNVLTGLLVIADALDGVTKAIKELKSETHIRLEKISDSIDSIAASQENISAR